MLNSNNKYFIPGLVTNGFRANNVIANNIENNQMKSLNFYTNNIKLNSDNIHLGKNAGNTNQSRNAIAIGVDAGSINQGVDATAIGINAGTNDQKPNAIAIGNNAGNLNQSNYAISIGLTAGKNNQNTGGIALGYRAGENDQEDNAIAIGSNAGRYSQGLNSIAIGRNACSDINAPQYKNSVCINASSSILNAPDSGFYVNPIRNISGNLTENPLCYNTTTSEIYRNTSKTFVIPHPNNNSKYLVHACLEGPEAGVYYRGENSITNDNFCQINLPEYVQYIACDFTINVTPIYNGEIVNLAVSKIKDNTFFVYGKNCEFFWNVYGKRFNIDVEPDINDVKINGDGPYKWIN